MHTTLVPAIIETTIKPKPTKREVLEAMAKLHIENIEKENSKLHKRRKEIEAELEKEARRIIKKTALAADARFGMAHYSNDQEMPAYVELEYKLPVVERSEKMTALLKEYWKLKKAARGVPKLKDAMLELRQAIEQTTPRDQRVDMLLADPKSRKALEESLAALN